MTDHSPLGPSCHVCQTIMEKYFACPKCGASTRPTNPLQGPPTTKTCVNCFKQTPTEWSKKDCCEHCGKDPDIESGGTPAPTAEPQAEERETAVRLFNKAIGNFPVKLSICKAWRRWFVRGYLAGRADQRAQTRVAAEELWTVKNALMEIRDAGELTPTKEEWIAAKLEQWAAAIRG
jgi:hypothetical protein